MSSYKKVFQFVIVGLDPLLRLLFLSHPFWPIVCFHHKHHIFFNSRAINDSQSRGVRFNCLNQSWAFPHKFNFTILKKLLIILMYLIYNLFAQSKTFSKSFPQNVHPCLLGLSPWYPKNFQLFSTFRPSYPNQNSHP